MTFFSLDSLVNTSCCFLVIVCVIRSAKFHSNSVRIIVALLVLVSAMLWLSIYIVLQFLRDLIEIFLNDSPLHIILLFSNSENHPFWEIFFLRR